MLSFYEIAHNKRLLASMTEEAGETLTYDEQLRKLEAMSQRHTRRSGLNQANTNEQIENPLDNL